MKEFTIADLWRGLGVLFLFLLLGMGIGAVEGWQHKKQVAEMVIGQACSTPEAWKRMNWHPCPKDEDCKCINGQWWIIIHQNRNHK
jgi:hypothetical protein